MAGRHSGSQEAAPGDLASHGLGRDGLMRDAETIATRLVASELSSKAGGQKGRDRAMECTCTCALHRTALSRTLAKPRSVDLPSRWIDSPNIQWPFRCMARREEHRRRAKQPQRWCLPKPAVSFIILQWMKNLGTECGEGASRARGRAEGRAKAFNVGGWKSTCS